LDEVNRVPTNLTNALFGVLDHNKALILNQPDLAKSALLTQEEKEIVSTPNGFHIADNIMIVATANIGYGFAGTFELDEAFLNRFAITEVFSTPTKNEVVDIVSRRSGLEFDISNKIVSVVIDLEKQVQQENMSADCTIRAMLNVAKLVYNGLTIRQAIDRAIINPVSVRYPHGIKPLVEYLNTILPPNVLKV
jgi:MoxR-like ATPase